MLKEALTRYTSKNKGGLRALAKLVKFNQSTVFSHMATGRIGIPLERAEQFAALLDMNAVDFTLAVLEQREPGVHALLAGAFDFEAGGAVSAEAGAIIAMVRRAQGLSADHVALIGDILREDVPVGRWAIGRNAELLGVIRAARPLGMDEAEWDELFAIVREFVSR
jgi:hypothetical protein